MTPEEANAAVDKLRATVRDSIRSGRGPGKDMDPETQKAVAETADKFLSDPAIRGAIAEQIKAFKMPWQGTWFVLSSVLVPIAFFGMIVLIFTLLHWRNQARLRAQTEVQTQLLTKFGSGAELAAFLNSPGGQYLLFQGVNAKPLNPKERMLKHTRLGAIFSIMGLGLLILSFFQDSDYAFLGVIAVGIGAGLLISARLSYRLSERMGLLDREAQEPSAPTMNTV